MRKTLTRLLIILALAYIAFCTIAFTFPEYFYYNPSKQKPDITHAQAYGYPAQEVYYQSADGTELYGWMTKPNGINKIILFLHGNAMDISYFLDKIIPFQKAGYGTFLAEYRGFGGIRGTIREQNIVADSIAAVKYLNSIGYKNENIIVYGISLGSHSAAKVVQGQKHTGKFDALILEVPFDSLTRTAMHHVPFYVPDFVVRDSYDNTDIIKEIDTRLLIQGGALDALVPIERAQALFEHAVEPKTIKIYPHADHYNLLEFNSYRDIMTWLEN